MEEKLLGYQAYLLAGFAFTLGLVCLVAYWRREDNPLTFILPAVLLVIFVWPPAILAISFYNVQRAKTVEFCSSCHQMDSHVKSLVDPQSTSLAGKHYQRHLINHNACYTCHTDYSLFGAIKAKLAGLGHMYAAYFTGIQEKEIHLWKPFPNHNCLQCHDTPKFKERDEHKEMESGDKCVDCHDDIHKTE